MNSKKDKELAKILDQLVESQNDEEAWTRLYKLMWPYVFSIMYRGLGGRMELAEDLSQEVFFRLVRYGRFDNFQEPGAFRAYVAKIARNEMSDQFRRTQSRTEVSLDYVSEGGEEQSVRENLSYLSPSISAEMQDQIHKVMLKLSEKDRALLRLLIKDVSLVEIANRLNITYNNAAVRVHRLRLKLRDSPLAHYLQPEEKKM